MYNGSYPFLITFWVVFIFILGLLRFLGKRRKDTPLSKWTKVVEIITVVSGAFVIFDVLQRNQLIPSQIQIYIPPDVSAGLVLVIMILILALVINRIPQLKGVKEALNKPILILVRPSERKKRKLEQLCNLEKTLENYVLESLLPSASSIWSDTQEAIRFNLLISEAKGLLGSNLNTDEFRVDPAFLDQIKEPKQHIKSLASKLLGEVKNHRQQMED